MEKPIYFLSHIFFDKPEVRVKIVDLETGNFFIMLLNEYEKIQCIKDFFLYKQDYEAICHLQAIFL